MITLLVFSCRKLLPQFPYSIGMTAREGMVTIRQHSTYFIPENDFVFGTEGASLFIDAVRGGGRPGRVMAWRLNELYAHISWRCYLQLPTPPQANDFAFDHAVVQLTTKSFNTVVHHDTSKDVLVLFYAPWCKSSRSVRASFYTDVLIPYLHAGGHCRSLKPAYESVARTFLEVV